MNNRPCTNMENWTQADVDAHLRKFGPALQPDGVAKQSKADAQAEKDLLRLCCHRLSQDGIEYLHLSPKAREKAGWPDLVFCVHGEPFAIELKARYGVVSEEQQQCLMRMKANGWVATVCRSYEEFCEAIGR